MSPGWISMYHREPHGGLRTHSGCVHRAGDASFLEYRTFVTGPIISMFYNTQCPTACAYMFEILLVLFRTR